MTEQNDALENSAEQDKAWALLGQQAQELENKINPEIEQENTEVEQDESADISVSELLAPAIKITADIFAPNWKLKQDELEQLSTVYGALVDKYLPGNDLTKYGVEITAIMTTAIIFGARVGTPRKIEEKEAKTETKQSNVLSAKPVNAGVENEKTA